MPDMARPWSSFTPEEQRVLAREMEVYAAMAEHTDYEIGRLIQVIEDLGELDNTLVVWVAVTTGVALRWSDRIGQPAGAVQWRARNDGEPAAAHRRSGWAESQRPLRHAMGPGELHADGGRAGPCDVFLNAQRHGDPLAEGHQGQGRNRPNFNMSSTWLRRCWRLRACRSRRS